MRAYDTGQLPIMASAVNHGVSVAADLGAWELAATLGAAVDDGPLAGLTILVHPAEHTARRAALDHVRAQLDADRYDAAAMHATAMTYRQVIEYTLAELDRLRAETDDNAAARSRQHARTRAQNRGCRARTGHAITAPRRALDPTFSVAPGLVDLYASGRGRTSAERAIGAT